MNVAKPLGIFLAATIAVSLLMIRTNTVTTAWTDDELNYALRTATQDATAVMMAPGYIFGAEEEPQDFAIDLERANEQFQSSFFSNIGSTINHNVINEMSVSLCGFAGYRYVYGVYGNGVTTAPVSYTYHSPTNNIIYEFTLGEKVYTTKLNDFTTGEVDISSLPEHYFHPTISNENFRTMTVMQAISKFLTLFYGDEANTTNITAISTDTGVEFELGIVDYASNDPSVMTKLSAVIDGPSFFAVVDCNDTRLDRVVRTMSIGAAELKLKG